MIRRALGLALVVLICSAHVGSPDVWYEGSAGSYPVLVVVRLPGVVPGVAQVTVRVNGRQSVNRVTLFVNRFDATAAAPPPEDAQRENGDSSTFVGKLWVMAPGSNSVTVSVYGPTGSGTAVVPVVAMATRRLPLYRWLGAILGAIGIFLFAGAISITGAAVREGTLAPGVVPDRARRSRARFAMAAAGLVVGLALVGGWTWWDSTDAAYQKAMYQPPTSRASVPVPGQLLLTITDSAWARRHDTTRTNRPRLTASALIPDHGKLMHLFLVAEDGGAFGHLHPTTTDTVDFRAALPPLPKGRYRVFADIVQESGFDQTLVATIELPAPPPAWVPSDSDDAWSTAAPSGHLVTLGDGSTLEWLGAEHVRVGEPAGLRFVASSLEPYMGMAAHAAVVRTDGGVFIHLHPMGTISSASQMALEQRQPGDSIGGTLARRLAQITPMQMTPLQMPPAGDTVSFPYAFPKAGRYTVWVQIKRGGRILTAPFVVDASDGA